MAIVDWRCGECLQLPLSQFWKKSFEALQQQEEEEHGSDEAKHLKQMLREKTEEVDILSTQA